MADDGERDGEEMGIGREKRLSDFFRNALNLNDDDDDVLKQQYIFFCEFRWWVSRFDSLAEETLFLETEVLVTY